MTSGTGGGTRSPLDLTGAVQRRVYLVMIVLALVAAGLAAVLLW